MTERLWYSSRSLAASIDASADTTGDITDLSGKKHEKQIVKLANWIEKQIKKEGLSVDRNYISLTATGYSVFIDREKLPRWIWRIVYPSASRGKK